jgi:hypothetical protein
MGTNNLPHHRQHCPFHAERETTGGGGEVMRIDAWIMLILGCLILYGGLTRSFYLAYKASKNAPPEAGTEEEEHIIPKTY